MNTHFKGILKSSLSLLFVVSTFSAQSQHIKHGIDSLSAISWNETPFFFPSGAESIIRVETPLVKSDYILLLYCKDSSFYSEFFEETPPHCSAFYKQHVNKMSLDSLSRIYRQCVRDYFYNPTTYAKIDTVFIYDENTLVDMHSPFITSSEEYFMTRMEMRTTDSSTIYRSEFYPVDQLKNACWTGAQFRMKSSESWENHKKNGNWNYYDTSGKLVRKIEYESGRIIKDEKY